ncbi:hypothetical protein AMATHDRAFT_143136, partial [Amanita thiersii Skay4041]
VHDHPYLIHLITWFIFFGPLAIIFPLLLLYELCVAVLFHLTFLFHGLIPGTGSASKTYARIRERTDDARQWLFVSVEDASNTYNKWTMEHTSLLVLRLASGICGLVILYCIWFIW